MAKVATELTLNPRLAQWIVQSIGRLLATFAILQGLNITFGGARRWGTDAFVIAMLVPGAPPTWGVVLLILGIIALVGSLKARFTPVVIGMLGGSVWCGFFALSFAISTLRNENAATTGVWAYGAFAVLFALIAVAYKESRKTVRG